MILSSTKKLMQYIADKENKTPLYSFLANKFLNNDQVEKSREICIAGENEFPQDAYGKYIRAKIENQRGNHDLYLEKLEECIKLDSGFLAAYYHLIADGKDDLPEEELVQYYQKLKNNNFANQEFLDKYSYLDRTPEDEEASKALKFRSLEREEEEPETRTRLRISRKTRDDNEDANEIDLKIPIPTMTFVDVLVRQELYDQALEVLDIIEQKTDKQELVSEKREEINTLKKRSDQE